MHTERVFSIGELSRELNVTPPAVRAWIRHGIIEEPQLAGGGAKLFTERQVRRIMQIITERRMQRLKSGKEHRS